MVSHFETTLPHNREYCHVSGGFNHHLTTAVFAESHRNSGEMVSNCVWCSPERLTSSLNPKRISAFLCSKIPRCIKCSRAIGPKFETCGFTVMVGAITVSDYLVTSNDYFRQWTRLKFERNDMKEFSLTCVRYGNSVNQALKIAGYWTPRVDGLDIESLCDNIRTVQSLYNNVMNSSSQHRKRGLDAAARICFSFNGNVTRDGSLLLKYKRRGLLLAADWRASPNLIRATSAEGGQRIHSY